VVSTDKMLPLRNSVSFEIESCAESKLKLLDFKYHDTDKPI